MSSASVVRMRRLLRRSGRLSPLFSILTALGAPAFVAPWAEAAPFLFASSEACAASGRFSRSSCEIAFANARMEWRVRSPVFPSRGKCQEKFRLCEKDGADERYRPTLLGVELAMSAGQAMATPILAVEPPLRTFIAQPISHLLETERPGAVGFPPILPAGQFHDETATSATPAVPATEGEAGASREATAPATRESARARRDRLRSAPYVE